MDFKDFILFEGLSYSKESIESTIKDIVEKKDEKKLHRWVGLAGGKEKLLQLIRNLSKSFSATIPNEFFKMLDKVSKDWRAVPRPKGVKIYGS